MCLDWMLECLVNLCECVYVEVEEEKTEEMKRRYREVHRGPKELLSCDQREVYFVTQAK